MNHLKEAAMAMAFLLLANADCACAHVQLNVPSDDRSKRIGDSALDDPSGKIHTREAVGGKVVVAIFSVPDMSQGGQQKKWSKLLTDDRDSKLPADVVLVLVEDMSQAGWFKGMALRRMKEKFTSKSRPFLLIDNSGDTFRKFNVGRDRTEILIFDHRGRLRDVENDLDREMETINRIKSITRYLE